MRGIILAGGSGSRMGDLTRVVSKQLLPVYYRPAIFYPLATLITAGINDVLVITRPQDGGAYMELLGDGRRWGIRINYAEQLLPAGVAQALTIGKRFLRGGPCCLILGDNIFADGFRSGSRLTETLEEAAKLQQGAHIFAVRVENPSRFGVVELDDNGRPLTLEEKPTEPRSNLAVPGIYFYDGKAADIAATLYPSARGELEITDLNKAYLASGELTVSVLENIYWADIGTPDALLDASVIIRLLTQEGYTLSSPDVAAGRRGWIQ